MKRLILALGIVLVMVLTLVAPAFASYNPDDDMYYSGGQEWFLFQADSTAPYFITNPADYHPYMMQRGVAPGETGSLWDGNPTFDFNVGDTLTFYADESANANVTFPTGDWILNLSCTLSMIKTWGYNVTAQVGYYDGSGFTWFGGFTPAISTKTGAVYLRAAVSSDSVPLGDTLVIQMTNNGTSEKILQSDGTNLYSPNSDPGYPLPELAAGVLLGGGLLGLGGFIWIRRKKSAIAI